MLSCLSSSPADLFHPSSHPYLKSLQSPDIFFLICPVHGLLNRSCCLWCPCSRWTSPGSFLCPWDLSLSFDVLAFRG